MIETAPMAMRAACKKCGGTEGYIAPRGGQDCVYCVSCNLFQYNAPRVETGREARSVTTVHKGIKPNQRSRVLMRANCRCEACGNASGVLHVGHLLSVKQGLEQGWTELELNSDANLACFCEECNLGQGKESTPLRFALLRVELNRGRPVVEARP